MENFVNLIQVCSTLCTQFSNLVSHAGADTRRSLTCLFGKHLFLGTAEAGTHYRVDSQKLDMPQSIALINVLVIVPTRL